MRGQPETAPDLGLGKKVEPREVIKPDWVPVEGKPDLWRNTKTGMLKGGKPKTSVEQIAEAWRRYGPVWPFFEPF